LKAVLAINRTVAAGLERNRRLLTASRTDHARALRGTALESPTASARLLVLLCLAAWLAPLGRRVTAVAKKLLVVGGKREYLSTVAASELQIVSHISLSFLFLLRAAFQEKSRP
jgi:hypothetical protein